MRRQLIVFLLAPMLLVLAGCNASATMQLYSNDTYTLTAEVKAPRGEVTNFDCDHLPGSLADAAANGQIRVTNRSTDNWVDCTLSFAQRQPVSAARSPFATIKHTGSTYRVELQPLADLQGLDSAGKQFHLAIVFPGQVTNAGSVPGAKVSGNRVEWTGTEVLAQGFTVEGMAVSGLTAGQRALIILGALLLIGVVLVVVFRRREPVAKVLAVSGKWLRETGQGLRLAVRETGQMFLGFLDWVFRLRQHTRARLNQKASAKNSPGSEDSASSA
ncbi:MAG: hypothetical protein SOS98_01090 [Varibaculum sp.]|nr:hypothetical protein [Varibaculum sp.]